MKKKALISSIVTIALCLSLIAGSTFALFTSEDSVNIAVTSGKVEIEASIEQANVNLFSAEKIVDGTTVPTGAPTFLDEYGKDYYHLDRTAEGSFTNGGTATVTNGVLNIDLITPGDKVTFGITGTNNSNVAIQYRYVIECIDGFDLMSGLVVTVDETAGSRSYESVASYESTWTALTANADFEVAVSVELPVQAGNEYQDLTNTKIRVTVEAVQGNADKTDAAPVVGYIEKVTDAAGVAAQLADADTEYILILDDIAEPMLVTNNTLKDKTLDAYGNDVAFVFGDGQHAVVLDNVTIKGIEDKGEGLTLDFANATGNVTVEDCVLRSAQGGYGFSAIKSSAGLDITVNDSVLNATTEGGKSYAVYGYTSGSLEFNNTTFDGFGSWAIQVNGTLVGDVTINKCTFNNCVKGLFKGGVGGQVGTSGNTEGVVTFTNNVITANDQAAFLASEWFGGSWENDLVASGNTVNGVAWDLSTYTRP